MIKKYQLFVEEISIKGNQGIPGEDGDKTVPYLSNIERRARARLGDNGRPLPEGDQLIYDQVGQEIMGLVEVSMSMTRGKEKELEELAKNVILDQYESILDGVDLDIKLVRPGEPNKMMDDEDDDEMPSFRETKDPELKREVDKAKIINNIIQGEAKNTKNILHSDIVKDGLKDIFGESDSKKIFSTWDRISKLSDKIDWMIPIPVRTRKMEEMPMGQAGAVKVEWNKKKEDEDKSKLAEDILKKLEDGESLNDNEEDISELLSDLTPKIKAVGIDFPMLLHETVRGIYELIAAHSISDNKEMAKKVKMNVSSLEDEAEDWRNGPELASDLRDYVNSVIDEMGKRESKILDIPNLREHFFGKLVDRNYLNTQEFLQLFKGILKNDPSVRNKVKEIIKEIFKEVSDFEKSQFSFNDDDIEDQKLKNVKSDKKDYSQMSKSQLQREIDLALDIEDYDKVKEVSNVLNKKYPEK